MGGPVGTGPFGECLSGCLAWVWYRRTAMETHTASPRPCMGGPPCPLISCSGRLSAGHHDRCRQHPCRRTSLVWRLTVCLHPDVSGRPTRAKPSPKTKRAGRSPPLHKLSTEDRRLKTVYWLDAGNRSAVAACARTDPGSGNCPSQRSRTTTNSGQSFFATGCAGGSRSASKLR